MDDESDMSSWKPMSVGEGETPAERVMINDELAKSIIEDLNESEVRVTAGNVIKWLQDTYPNHEFRFSPKSIDKLKSALSQQSRPELNERKFKKKNK
jgi:hypothetical protein